MKRGREDGGEGDRKRKREERTREIGHIGEKKGITPQSGLIQHALTGKLLWNQTRAGNWLISIASN